MQLKFDLNVGALYIRLNDEGVTRTRELDDNTLVDLDAAGRVIGIEVVSAAHPFALAEILASYDISPSDAEQLRVYFGLPTMSSQMATPRTAPAPVRARPNLSIEQVSPLVLQVA
jgi:uncharacterized protein YuzE